MLVRQHLLLASTTGALIGLAEGLASADAGGALTVLTAVGLGWIGGGLWGGVQALLDRATRPLWRVAGQALALDGERSAVVRRHAFVVAGLLLVPPFAFALQKLSLRLEAINDAAASALVIAGAGAVGLVGVAAGVVVLGGLLMRPIAAIDRRVGLPRPRAAIHRLLLYVAAPAALAAATVLRSVGHRLAGLAVVPWAVVWLALEVLLAVAALAVSRRVRVGAKVGRAVTAGMAVLAVVAVALAEGRRDVHTEIGATHAPALARALLRRAADVDRDGNASVLGDRDCAPWDAAIGPLSAEIPDNGVDEDCDGVDAKARVETLTTYSGALADKDVRKYNVVLIVVDAMRADFTHLLGYGKATTPYLDKLAEKSLVFERALAQSSATMMSIPSLQAGRWPGALTWTSERERIQMHEGTPTLAERLAAAGYRTGIVGSSYFFDRLPGILRGYAVTRNIGPTLKEKPAVRRSEAITTSWAVEFLAPHLAGVDKKPFFLTVYYEDPHHPYVGRANAGYPSFGGDEKGRYAAEIAAMDRYIGVLLDILRWSKLWKDTIVIVTSDHGEEFGEHGGSLHAQTCYIESLHVPLVVRVPGVEAKRVKEPVALVDIVPTILELTGVDRDATLDGQSLLTHALAPELVQSDRPIFCTLLHLSPGLALRHAVRAGSLTLIQDALADTFEMFDRAEDPKEAKPIEAGDEARAAERQALAELLRAHATGNIAQFAR